MLTSTGVAEHPVVTTVRAWVETEVRHVAPELDHADRYPHALVQRMQEMGLFGALVPVTYGGLGLDVSTYARVIEEICRGWMSLAGVLNSHTMAALIVLRHGTEEQRGRFLPPFARGDARGGLCLTEPHAGSDVQAIRTRATRRGDHYVVNGTKMFVTNGREGNTFALLALTDPAAQPRHKGMSCFIVEKGASAFTVVKSISKLGYKGVDTAELLFDDVVVPASNLVGGVEGRGFKHVMSGLETGRINIAARAAGVARAAYDEAVERLRSSGTVAPRLADMAVRVTSARLLTYWAAGMNDRGERCDLEAGMAKLYASEAAQQVATDALLIAGEAGQLESGTIERHYRDAPLMIIGEGTNEIQRTIIARALLQRYGERLGALTSRDAEPQERRQMVLALRQLVDKTVAPLAGESQEYPAGVIAQLADIGILGAGVPADSGGLPLDQPTFAMLIEELARGSAAVAAIVTAHLAVAQTLSRFGTAAQRGRLLPAMTRGETIASAAFDGGPSLDAVELVARNAGAEWLLTGCARVENGSHATAFLLLARHEGGASCFLVPRAGAGITVQSRGPMLGCRGVELSEVRLDGVACPITSIVGGVAGHGDAHIGVTAAVARLGVAAIAVGVAQASFEAALRYAQQRSTFGKPICEHQAVQLKLADMATALAAARLLTYEAAARLEGGTATEGATDDTLLRMAKVYATEVAVDVTLESMRIHGGYGYTTEFPVERYYRDATRLMLALGGNDAERLVLARRLANGTAVATAGNAAPGRID